MGTVGGFLRSLGGLDSLLPGAPLVQHTKREEAL